MKDQIEGLVSRPLQKHIDKLAGRGSMADGDPRDPRNRNDWIKHAKRAWNNILKLLYKLNKPLVQVLRELGWSEEKIEKLITDIKESGIDFDDVEKVIKE